MRHLNLGSDALIIEFSYLCPALDYILFSCVQRW
eukprot:SAG31_NODE_24018_length_491_cov_0.645408_1_plen_33_part_01